MDLETIKPLSSKEVFTFGIACHAIVCAHHVGIFEELKTFEFDEEAFLKKKKFLCPVVLDGIIRSLLYARILKLNNKGYVLTNLGQDIVDNLSSYLLWFEGYSILLSKQNNIASGTESFSYQQINSQVVANNSATIGRRFADNHLLEALKSLNPKSLCDLGCGNGTRLITLCEKFKIPGHGIDISKQAIRLAKENALNVNQNFTFSVCDVTNIEDIWENIEVGMQTFMTHHIIPDAFCASVFKRYKNIFPNMKYFLLLEVVSSEREELTSDNFVPGFDYIHRLQGLKPRTKKDMLNIFIESEYNIINEVKLNLTNGFLWVLKLR